jgi:phosphohistidine phosphatase
VKTLYLLRHAKSAWDDSSLDDFDRPLNERGRTTATRMGAFLARERLVPATVVCSAACRAVETWARIAPALEHPEARVETDLYGASCDDILSIARELPATAESALLVGHNPGMGDTALRLAGAGDPRLIERMERKFPTCSLAIITFEVAEWEEVAEGRGRLERFVRGRDV